jgi:predicted porin
MKKTLIAFAALTAIAGVAQAQSTVTIYGLVDAGYVASNKETTGVGAVAKLSQNSINSSNMNNSRWGLKGSEDLGNGLAAVFTLESGFNTDTGASANLSPGATQTAFGRQAFVGLSSSTMGTVSLGRQYTAYDALRSASNNIDDTNFATNGAVWGGVGLAGYTNRASNSIAYTSPTFSGFSGAAVIGLGEDKTATTDASNLSSVHVKYVNGPILAGYAYQEEKNGATGVKNKYNLVGGSYDLGVAKLVAAYNTAKNGVISEKDYNLGVKAPIGATTLYAGYSHSKADSTGVSNKGTGFSLVASYSLSKRTTLYTGYTNTKLESANAATQVKATALALGVRHTF